MLNQENLTAIKIAIEKEIKLGKKQVGWKLGFGSQAGLKALGINRPLIGALFDSGEIRSNTKIDLEAVIEPRVEAELAAHISSDIPSDATFDQIKNCISSLVAGIEFVDFHSPPKSPAFVLSENIYQRGWIVDVDKRTGWGDGVNNCQITATMGPERWEPFENIETLIGTLEDNFGECNLVANQLGRGILRDDVILLGSMFPPHPVNMSDFVVSMNGSEIALGFKS
ncbi:MAG: hypothetical protein CML91_06965 [Rhodobiaceae bacterium]|nr:hypothetical protein [Rhodobiaceae bacterium]|tara:strand:+ start:1045 stop:1722 length:678 start_codon:yes stop_codon:yes gene_type:complete